MLAADFPAGLGGVDWAGAEAPGAAGDRRAEDAREVRAHRVVDEEQFRVFLVRDDVGDACGDRDRGDARRPDERVDLGLQEKVHDFRRDHPGGGPEDEGDEAERDDLDRLQAGKVFGEFRAVGFRLFLRRVVAGAEPVLALLGKGEERHSADDEEIGIQRAGRTPRVRVAEIFCLGREMQLRVACLDAVTAGDRVADKLDFAGLLRGEPAGWQRDCRRAAFRRPPARIV